MFARFISRTPETASARQGSSWNLWPYILPTGAQPINFFYLLRPRRRPFRPFNTLAPTPVALRTTNITANGVKAQPTKKANTNGKYSANKGEVYVVVLAIMVEASGIVKIANIGSIMFYAFLLINTTFVPGPGLEPGQPVEKKSHAWRLSKNSGWRLLPGLFLRFFPKFPICLDLSILTDPFPDFFS